MNFEFKSTFNKTRPNRTDPGVWLFLINITLLLTIGLMYLNNDLIPATYGSKPNGADWILGFKITGIIWGITTMWAAKRCLYRYLSRWKIPLLLRFRDRLREAFQTVVFQVFFNIHLMTTKQLSGYTQKDFVNLLFCATSFEWLKIK